MIDMPLSPKVAQWLRTEDHDALHASDLSIGNYSEAESLDCIPRALRRIRLDELPKCIVVVDREKIRRRWLPV